MPQIIIKALTEKGRGVVMSSEGKQSRMGATALIMAGVRESVVCNDPLTIIIKMKMIPQVVVDQMLVGLATKFESMGAKKDKDFLLEAK